MGAEAKQGCSRCSCRTFFRGMTSPLLLSFIWFLVTLYFNSVLSIEAERQGGNNNPILEDEGFEELGSQIDIFDLPNYMLFALLGATLIRFLPIWPCVKPAMFWMILRRWFFLEGVIFILRGFSVAMTSVPAPSALCTSTATGNVWIEAIYITFGKHHTCADCMFSGHTAAITLLVMMWTHYSRGEELAICFGSRRGIITNNVDAAGDPVGWKIIDLPLWAYAIVSYWIIIVTRFHYSHDVFIGFLVTYFLFNAYHFYIKALAMRQGSMFSRFMRWFEGLNLSHENLVKEQDLESAGQHRGFTSTGPLQSPRGASLTQTALALGQDATKDNVLFLSKGVPPVATLLPVSYLEGREYYRAGEPNARDQLRLGLGAKDQNEVDRRYAADAARAKDEEEDSQVMHNPHGGPVPIGGYEQPQTQSNSVSSMAPVRVHTGAPDATGFGANVGAGAAYPQLGGDAARHNYQQPAPILVTGEHAQQERREVEREHGVRLS